MTKPVLNIDDLNTTERLDLIEELWESLEETPQDVPLTKAQGEELDRRLNAFESGETEGIPWEEVLREVRKNTK